MARINIEECWWSDPRRSKLIRLLGGDTRKADGLAIEAWRLAQEFWKHDRNLIPLGHFEALEDSHCLLQAGLAEVRDEHVYVRGSSQYLDWVKEQREAAALAGRISAQRPRDEKGRLLPKVQQVSNDDPTPSNEVQPSVSGSSNTNTNTYRAIEEEFDFEKIYQAYPRRKGNQRKAKGMEVCRKRFNRTDLYDSLLTAVKNYALFCQREKKTGTEWVSQFATFVGGVWEEWVVAPGLEVEPKSAEEYFQ